MNRLKNKLEISTYSTLYSIVLVLAIQTLHAQNILLEGQWNLQTDHNGIEIYTRSNSESNNKEVRIVTNFNASITELEAIISDVSRFNNWVYKCKSAESIHEPDAQHSYSYAEYDFPFPADNRDIVILSKRWEDQQTGSIYFHSTAAPDYIPQKENLVRIKEMESYWIITPNEDGTTALEYMIKTSVGGNIPSWMVNLAVTTGPKNTFENLAIQLDKNKQRMASN